MGVSISESLTDVKIEALSDNGPQKRISLKSFSSLLRRLIERIRRLARSV